ncbi:hypothetical protein RM844_29365 [Streptomyces sp. DSM 44915]|uniref:Heparin-binding hemagglutinin n=1 Tax=Streptomyces chisholmiae TaxID=3075540 RepID=A0ABU2JZI7_9ACTN|nr:hypothetical protein [Streptomyces sp. DSM 44915]MDT0270389.1 hypothetical protein [Streptomyces sp. DSM 44915]
MAITDDLRKSLSDSTPLYVAAGTADLAAQKLRELPAALERLRAEAPERLPQLRERAQHAALTGVGLALEYAVKARETYDGLAERGKTVVERRRGEERAAEDDWSEVRVEREPAPAAAEPVTEPAVVTEEAAAAEAAAAPATPKTEPVAEAATKPEPVAGTTTTTETATATEPAAEAAAEPAKPKRANGNRRTATRAPKKMPPKN